MLDDWIESLEARLEHQEHNLPPWIWKWMDVVFMVVMLALMLLFGAIMAVTGRKK